MGENARSRRPGRDFGTAPEGEDTSAMTRAEILEALGEPGEGRAFEESRQVEQAVDDETGVSSMRPSDTGPDSMTPMFREPPGR